MPLPSGLTIEVEFVAGTWTDVTADFDYNAGYTITVGRSSPQQQPGPSSCTLSLRNSTGKYTPGLQVLADGSPAPFFPNVVPQKRLRVSTSAGVRFVGSVQSWSPLLDNGVLGRCQVQAIDLMDRLSRVQLQPAMRQEILADSPTWYWAMADQVGSLVARSTVAGSKSLVYTGSGLPNVTMGDPGPGDAGDGTAAKFTPVSSSLGRYFVQVGLPGVPFGSGKAATFELWCNPGVSLPAWAGTDDEYLAAFSNNYPYYSTTVNVIFRLNGTGTPVYDDLTHTVTGPAPITDGLWHHLVAVFGGGSSVSFYVDGVFAGSTSVAPADSANAITVGSGLDSISVDSHRYQGDVAHVAAYRSALSPTRIAAHYASGRGYGETVDERIARFLTAAGLTSADWDLDSSSVVLAGYDETGKDVVTASQDAVASEGGGAVFYVLAGVVVFRNRDYRNPAAPTLTVSAAADIAGDTYQPGIDSQNLINSVTVTQSTGTGSAGEQTASDADSIATYGLFAGAATSYASDPGDVLALAQAIVAAGRTPGFRLPQLCVDLLTAQSNLYAAVQATQIGSRIRATALPAGSAPASQVDVIAEGWTETVKVDTFRVVYDTSPADNPAPMIWGDTTHGDWQCDGQTLNTALTVAATTVKIATVAGKPTFTTAPGAYPLEVQIGGEHIRLNSAPSGSASPQTFTGCSRGVDGTPAAAQSAGAAVTLEPLSTWTL